MTTFSRVRERLNAQPREKGERLRSTEKMAILACWGEGLGSTVTARKVGVSKATVDSFRAAVRHDPVEAVKGLPVVEVVKKEGKSAYRCEWCHQVKKTRGAAVKCFLGHIIPRPLVSNKNQE